MPTTRYSAPSCSAHRRSRYSVLSARAVRVTPPRCAGCVTPHRRQRYSAPPRNPLLREALLGELALERARGPLCARAVSRRRQAPYMATRGCAIEHALGPAPIRPTLNGGADDRAYSHAVLTRTRAYSHGPYPPTRLGSIHVLLASDYAEQVHTYQLAKHILADEHDRHRPARRYLSMFARARRQFCSSSRSSSPVRHAHALWDLL